MSRVESELANNLSQRVELNQATVSVVQSPPCLSASPHHVHETGSVYVSPVAPCVSPLTPRPSTSGQSQSPQHPEASPQVEMWRMREQSPPPSQDTGSPSRTTRQQSALSSHAGTPLHIRSPRIPPASAAARQLFLH